MTEYRIVRDDYLGFEVQARRWWWPFWSQVYINTHSTIAAAEEYARRKSSSSGVVKYLGTLPAPTPPGEQP